MKIRDLNFAQPPRKRPHHLKTAGRHLLRHAEGGAECCAVVPAAQQRSVKSGADKTLRRVEKCGDLRLRDLRLQRKHKPTADTKQSSVAARPTQAPRKKYQRRKNIIAAYTGSSQSGRPPLQVPRLCGAGKVPSMSQGMIQNSCWEDGGRSVCAMKLRGQGKQDKG